MRINDWWSEIGRDASILLGCCLIVMPVLAIIDLLEKPHVED